MNSFSRVQADTYAVPHNCMLSPTTEHHPLLSYTAPHSSFITHSCATSPDTSTCLQDFLWTPHVRDLQPDSPNYERSVR